MDQSLPAPTAQGAFAKTPFPHVLVYALEQRLTGSFDLVVGDQSVATLLVIQGVPAKVRTADAVHFLGDVMLGLGLINPDQHAASLQRLQESPRLHGQVLIEMGFLDEQRVMMGVRAQLEAKLDHLFTLPVETMFAFYDQIDLLQRFGGPPTPIDPFPALWRGVRQSPSWEHVDGTLRRVGQNAICISPRSQIERFLLGRAEAAAIDLLRQRPMRVIDVANAKVVGPSVAQLLIYLLVITKQVDLVETGSMRPSASPSGRIPAAPGSAPPAPGSQPGVAGGPPQPSQAFARVQLQARQVQRSPLIVEEVPSSVARGDGRASPISTPSPFPPAGGDFSQQDPTRPPTVPTDFVVSPPTGASPMVPPPPTVDVPSAAAAAFGGMDIASMINSTINSSMPPPMPMASEPPPPSVPPSGSSSRIPQAGPSSQNSIPAAPSSGRLPAEGHQLTAEQTSLKSKIMERAAAITSQDYFQMLGIDRDASAEQVQKSFLQLAKVWHPDRLPPALVDVKDACSKVFAHLTEANATLTDPKRRTEYMTLLKDGGATPDDQAKIQGIVEAATEFQKAEFHLKRNEIAQAYEIAKRVYALDPEQADYLAMITWIEAQRPDWLGREKTLEKIAVLDRCLKMNNNCERAYFWRGMLYKRIDEMSKAMKDFKKAAEINPRNLDAAREVRLHNIRGGPSSGGRKGPPQPETLGGLFGKLFKK
jgi:curved DNA-binding protein CbpA